MEKYIDPIVQEVREQRARIWEEAKGDIDTLLRDAAEFAVRVGAHFAPLAPLKPVPLQG